jgi:glycosyltransferase involved in cell wall biosynthesis
LDELLESLTQQREKNFEVVVVEDGSVRDSRGVVEKYAAVLSLRYVVRPNGGPAAARNTGIAHANGDYFVFFDSDCIVPPEYFGVVRSALARDGWEAYGGPERAMDTFSVFQRATSYTMTALLTTGGIRGGKRRVGAYQPRSYNMGMSRGAAERSGGFDPSFRFGEDVDLSLRLYALGCKVGLINEAFVYHKRRTGPGAFFRQLSQFARGRVAVARRHPGSLKPTHFFPTAFALFTISLPFWFGMDDAAGWLATGMWASYLTAVGMGAALTYRSWAVGLVAPLAALIQMFGYGSGFVRAWWLKK